MTDLSLKSFKTATIALSILWGLTLLAGFLLYFLVPYCNKSIDFDQECSKRFCKNDNLTETWADECSKDKSTSTVSISSFSSTSSTSSTSASSTTDNTNSIITTTPTRQTTTTQKQLGRLPQDLMPLNYDIEIKPYIGRNTAWVWSQDFTFDGKLAIEFICNNPTMQIVFHSKNLTLNNIIVQSPPEHDFGTISKTEFDDETDFVTVSMYNTCKESVVYVLKINFAGRIQDDLYGLHKGSYSMDTDGNISNYITTNFMPTHARRVFPCWDEPAFKATFKMTLSRHRSFSTSLFNTPLLGSTQIGEWFLDSFKQTVKLPTYLIAFSIGNFNQLTVTTPRGIKCETVAIPQAIDAQQLNFTLNQIVLIVDFSEQYFDYLYPFGKITFLSVSDNMIGNSIDNSALVSGKERILLYTKNTNSILNEKQILQLVSKSLSRQWFGNFVTQTWWNNYWFYEGFVLWFKNLGTNFANPKFRSLEYFFLEQLDLFEDDSFETSDPIVVSGIQDFSLLLKNLQSHRKTSNILRMLSAAVTETTFKKGVSTFLRSYRFGNANPEDLMEHIATQATFDNTLDKRINLVEFLNSWTLHKGYPLVTIYRTNLNTITVKQTWFLVNPLNTIQATPENTTQKWYIPLTFTHKDELDFNLEKTPYWIIPSEASEVTLDINGIFSFQSWIIANLQHSGYYRVNYDLNNWYVLIDQLKTMNTLIHPVNRAQLLDDLFNLGRAEIVDQMTFLEMCKYLKNELDPLPFSAALVGLNAINKLIEDNLEIYENFKSFYILLLLPMYNRLNWDLYLNEELLSFQISMLNVMCYFGHDDCILRARQYFTNWTISNRPLPINFKTVIYSTIARHGTENDWNDLYQIAINKTTYDERVLILNSLASTNRDSQLIFLYRRITDNNVILHKDRPTLLKSFGSNVNGRSLAYDYLEENWSQIYTEYEKEPNMLFEIVNSCTRHLNKNFNLQRFLNFIDSIPNLGVAKTAFSRAVENIKMNIRWLEINQQKLNNWLN